MQPFEIVAYQWVVNEFHPRLATGAFSPLKGSGGDLVAVGQEGRRFEGPPPPNTAWGLDQIWHLRNGQRVVAKKLPRG